MMSSSTSDNEDITRILALYTDYSKNFQKIFAILLVFGLFFLLTAVFPYFSNIYEQKEKQRKIDNYTEAIQNYNLTISDLEKNKIPHFTKVIKEVNKNITNTNSTINENIIIVNKLLERVGKSVNQSNNISDVKELNDMLQSTTEFARDATMRIRNIYLNTLNTQLEKYKGYNASLYEQLNSNLTTKQMLEIDRNNTIMSKQNDTARLQNLTDQWNEINSPLGSVPIDFTNLVAIFPISLIGGFLVCKSLLSNLIHLRRSLAPIYDEQSKKFGTNKGHVNIVAPLWIDHKDPVKKKAMRFSVLLLPFGIFLVCIFMISYSWENAPNPPFISSSELSKNIYYGIYTLSFGFFIYSYICIIKEARY